MTQTLPPCGRLNDVKILFTGKELRQDDETVWLRLIHLARENGLSKPFQFTPYSFCKAINWPINGQSFDRLDKCMTRLQTTSLKIASQRLGDEVSLSMLPGFKANRRKEGDGGLWTVRMHDELARSKACHHQDEERPALRRALV
jgi:hypothetical protein